MIRTRKHALSAILPLALLMATTGSAFAMQEVQPKPEALPQAQSSNPAASSEMPTDAAAGQPANTPQVQPKPQALPQAQSSNPAASAQDANGTPSFDQLDTNHDGKLTRSEIPRDVPALQQLRAHFMEADSDGNGSLKPNEYAAYTASSTPSPSGL